MYKVAFELEATLKGKAKRRSEGREVKKAREHRWLPPSLPAPFSLDFSIQARAPGVHPKQGRDEYEPWR